LKHTASKRFWQCFDALSPEVQALARRNYRLLRLDPSHRSLAFKQIAGATLYSVRIGLHIRALGLPVPQGVHWFWIGAHAEYDKLIAQM
jgi:hypothetical protein